MLSRRSLLIKGSKAGVLSLVSTPLLSAASGNQKPVSLSSNVNDYVVVMHASDPLFADRLSELFPGLLADGTFQKIQSQAVLVTNVSSHKISSYSARWKVTTGTGSYERLSVHSFHPNSRHRRTVTFGRKGNKTRFTGKIPAIAPGATRLMTPFFNWSPKHFAKNPSPAWDKILGLTEARKFSLYEALNAKGVQVTIESLVVKRKFLIGNDTANIGKKFNLTRNAEHDAAVSINRLLQAGATSDQIRAKLQASFSAPLPSRETPMHHLYQAVRKRQTKILLKRLNQSTPAQFKKTIAYLVKQPKTTVKALAA